VGDHLIGPTDDCLVKEGFHSVRDHSFIHLFKKIKQVT